MGRSGIDLVTTWTHKPNVSGYCKATYNRHRNLHTFRFALRSWLRFMPWISNIWIVTDRAPCWLNESALPNIHVVLHREIWPDAVARRDLPTFNSQAIETHLHRISGLSERFIYFNDDMMVGKPLSSQNFFEGNAPVFSKLSDKYPPIESTAPKLLMLDHGPYPTTISIIKEVQSKWTSWFDKHSSDRCRKHLSPPFWAYQWYAIATKAVSRHVSEKVQFVCCDNERPDAQMKIYARLYANPPGTIVLNDDFKQDSWIDPMQTFMETYYGMKLAAVENYDRCALYTTQTAQLNRLELGHVGEGSLPRSLGPGNSGTTFRVVLLNAMRGFNHRTFCTMLKTHKDLKGAPIVLLNEIDIGMARTGNKNVARELAKCMHMNYAYGAEFYERTLGQPHEKAKLNKSAANTHALRGNMILSTLPLRDEVLLRLPGTSAYWGKGGFDGEYRDGDRNAIVASVPILCDPEGRTEWIDVVSTHLDAFVKKEYNQASAQRIHQLLLSRKRSTRIIGGDMGSHTRVNGSSVFEAYDYRIRQNYGGQGRSGDWLFSNTHMANLKVVHAPGSDHNFLSATFTVVCDPK